MDTSHLNCSVNLTDCEVCKSFFLNKCEIHGPPLFIPDTLVPMGVPDRARQTLPPGLEIQKSSIPDAGLGVFNKGGTVPVGAHFGPYQGELVNGEEAGNSGDSLVVYRSMQCEQYIDAKREMDVNWMRYVNCARNEEEQNLVAFRYRGGILYRCCRPINPGHELLVWYEEEYTKELSPAPIGTTSQQGGVGAEDPIHEPLERSRRPKQPKRKCDKLVMPLCPLCDVDHKYLRQHLRKGHHVVNNDELDLLMLYASGRGVKGRLYCMECQIKCVRLDKHFLQSHKNWTAEQRKDMYNQGIQKKALDGLRALRLTFPVLPMVSQLDITEEDLREVPADPILPASPDAPAGPAASPDAPAGPAASPNAPTGPAASCDAPAGPAASRDAPAGPAATSSAAPAPAKGRSILSCPGCRAREEANRRLRHNNILLRGKIKLLMGKKEKKRVKFQKRREAATEDDSGEPGYEILLSKYKGRITTENATCKEQSNTQQRVQSVRQFLINSAVGGVPHADLLYLRDHSRIREAVRTWVASGLKPTTVKKKIIDTMDFLKWVGRAWPGGVRLSQRSIEGLKDELSRELRSLRGSVTSHVVSVRRNKSENVLPLAVHRNFIKKANKLLPQFFKKAVTTKKRPQIQRFLALLAGLIISETGHRITVLKNMRGTDVLEAREAGQCHVIYVKEHKTRRTFGDARVPVHANVYRMMKTWMKRREDLQGWEGPFFSSSAGGRAPLLLEDFKRTWLDLGFPAPPPTFNALRSSLATHAVKTAGEREAAQIAQLMCHDLETSKKFYKAHPPPKATAQVRSAILRTMMTGDEEDNDSEGEEDNDSQGEEPGEEQGEELGEEKGEESGEERAEEEDEDSDEEEEDEDSDASEEEGIQMTEETEDESEVEQVGGCKRKARAQIIGDSSEEEKEEERSRKRTRRALFTGGDPDEGTSKSSHWRSASRPRTPSRKQGTRSPSTPQGARSPSTPQGAHTPSRRLHMLKKKILATKRRLGVLISPLTPRRIGRWTGLRTPSKRRAQGFNLLPLRRKGLMTPSPKKIRPLLSPSLIESPPTQTSPPPRSSTLSVSSLICTKEMNPSQYSV
ncbi:uncharacterized protein LOC132870983 isoform X3 [Neoarius graeffei]|uniref:uncharacterized protein LOC132870983 isoform X3 n=1 Tax=Neoarius graeffei TaxID=443677 RepID=UPI00298C9645|nr:uncharacterized protein LOC132870983 isoform X3 [Neoarius graeffei]